MVSVADAREDAGSANAWMAFAELDPEPLACPLHTTVGQRFPKPEGKILYVIECCDSAEPPGWMRLAHSACGLFIAMAHG